MVILHCPCIQAVTNFTRGRYIVYILAVAMVKGDVSVRWSDNLTAHLEKKVFAARRRGQNNNHE